MSETPPHPYGEMARKHWAKWRPNELSQIPDPETFFFSLGQEVESQIEVLAAALAGDDPGGEDYLEKVGRLRMARFTAEGQILREMVLLAAEPGHPQYDPQDEDDRSIMPAATPWLPVAMTPDHPNYHDLDDDPFLRKITPPTSSEPGP